MTLVQWRRVCSSTHQSDIIWNPDGTIKTSRFRGFHTPTWTTPEVHHTDLEIHRVRR